MIMGLLSFPDFTVLEEKADFLAAPESVEPPAYQASCDATEFRNASFS